MQAFASRRFEPAALAVRSAHDRAASDRWMFVNLGAMEIVAIESADDSSVTAVVRQGLIEGWGRVTVKVSPRNDQLLLSRSITFFEPPPTRAKRRSVDMAHVLDLEAYARRLAVADVFSGVVALSVGDSIVFAHAYGLAHRESATPNGVDTRFQLASVSKMFTAVAVAQLVERGKLAFTDTLAKLLPDYPNPETARLITVEQLLAHTSGIPDYFSIASYFDRQAALHDLRDYWAVFAAERLRFSPGKSYEYSSSGYILLGSIIERVSGQPFREYIAEHVFGPAGMSATSYEEGSEVLPRATAYTKAFGPGRKADPDHWHEVTVPITRMAMSSGGGTSTAGDLTRFMNALLRHRLLTKRMTDVVLAEHVQSEEGNRGYGFESNVWNGTRVVGHNGFAPGAFNQVDAYPELGVVIVVLSNGDTSGGGAIPYWLRLRLLG